jgi:hypothetical protein
VPAGLEHLYRQVVDPGFHRFNLLWRDNYIIDGADEECWDVDDLIDALERFPVACPVSIPVDRVSEARAFECTDKVRLFFVTQKRFAAGFPA